jgi:hypothetical protein
VPRRTRNSDVLGTTVSNTETAENMG